MAEIGGVGLVPRQRVGLVKHAAALVAVAMCAYAVCILQQMSSADNSSVVLEETQELSSYPWTKHVDKVNGKTYYYNRMTRSSQWSAPSGWQTRARVSTHLKHLKHKLNAASMALSMGSKLEGEPTSHYVAEPAGGAVWAASIVIFTCGTIGLLFAGFLFYTVSQISLDTDAATEDEKKSDAELKEIYEVIREGANSFLWAEYKICFIFIAVFGLLVLVLTSHVSDESGNGVWKWNVGALTAFSFLVGGLTSILSGYIGMMVAVFSNARTAVSAKKSGDAGWTASFNCAFRAGGVMGYSLVAISMMILYILALIYRDIFSEWDGDVRSVDYKTLFECLAGYGLGGSSIAMFGRVGGGIFTKAADVGADLSGKVIGVGGQKLDEDSPFNPGVIADNVGDNVGDVAGMGSDLFGSFGEASCAALLIGASCIGIEEAGWTAIVFPLYIASAGLIVCLLVSFLATDVMPVKKEEDIEFALKVQLGGTALLMTFVMFPITYAVLPPAMQIMGVETPVSPFGVFLCVAAGLWGGCAIGFITEYYTSHSYQPVRDVARSSETGAATNIIYGLALGYQSVVLPVFIISGIIFLSFKMAGMYGVANAALGMLGTLATCLAIDVYGPIADNAGGVAEMSEMDPSVRDKTDALDAAGNTTAAIGKGFAIGSAALVSLALFGAFITRCSTNMPIEDALTTKGVNLLSPIVFASILFGAMVPYWFSAMTMRSVGEAANAMVLEIARQFAESTEAKIGSKNCLCHVAGLDFHARQEFKAQLAKKGESLVKPDYERCIAISTEASLREMVLPGFLVMVTPVLAGTFLGVEAVSGLLAGAIVSSVQLAISMSNTGGAWDNSKKYTEKGELNGYFPFREKTEDMEGFKSAAEQEGNHGSVCLTNYGSTGKKLTEDKAAEDSGDIKTMLEDLKKKDKARYEKILAGEEGVRTKDGRFVVYAGKKSNVHAAAVVGDTVGDPLKDTSGPALNIVMKLMAIISVVFADFFMSTNHGNGIFCAGDLVGGCY